MDMPAGKDPNVALSRKEFITYLKLCKDPAILDYPFPAIQLKYSIGIRNLIAVSRTPGVFPQDPAIQKGARPRSAVSRLSLPCSAPTGFYELPSRPRP